MAEWEDAPSSTGGWEDAPTTTASTKGPKGGVYVKPLPGLSAETTAGIYSFAEQASSLGRGALQLAQEKFSGLEDILPEGMKKSTIEEQVKKRRALEETPEYRKGAIAGTIAGAVLEPVSLAVPLGKARTVKQFATQAGAVGLGTGYLGAKEEKDSRVEQAALGGLAGFGGGLVIGSVAKRVGEIIGKDWFAGKSELSDVQLDAITKAVKEDHPKASPREIKQAVDAWTTLPPDAHLNAQQTASKLVEEGASIRKVEAVTKKNPLVGHYVDQIMQARREMVRGRLDAVKQGEVMEPEAFPTARPMEEPKGETIDAVQESSAESLLPRKQEEAGVSGSEREGMGQGQQGQEAAKEIEDQTQKPLGGVGKRGFGQGGAWTPFGGSDTTTNTGLGKELLDETKSAGKDIGKVLDQLAGHVMTRISNISPELGRATLDVDRKIIQDTHSGITISDPFFTHINTDVSKKTAEAFKEGWLNQNREGIATALTGKAKESFQKMTETLDTIGDQLASRGIIAGKLEGYLPRMVKDREGMLSHLGVEAKNTLEKKLEETATTKGRALTPEEEANIINQFFRSGTPGMYKPGFAKSRTMEDIDKELSKFYYDPAETYHSYVQRAVNDIHLHDFFGKSSVVEDGALNVEKSIGNFVQELQTKGELTPEKLKELKNLLDARYKAGEMIARPSVQLYKNVSTALALGNVTSAALNITDPLMAAFRYGIKPALRATLESLKGVAEPVTGVASKQQLSTKDYGLLDHISEEFVNSAPSQRLVNRVMKYSGWGVLDSFGKNTHFNSSLLRAQNWAKSEEGMTRLQKRYGEAFGEQFPQLVQDLRSGEVTDLVKSMSFWDVAQHQPLTRLQRSEVQLRHPNITSLTHQFKSFMMSQANLVRVDAYNEIKKGNVKEGLINLARLGAGFAIVGAGAQQIQNFLLGRDTDMEGIDIVNNAFKQVGYSDYAMQKFREGKVKEGVASYISPAGQVIDVGSAAYGRVKADITGKDSAKDRKKEEYTLTKAIPVVGRTIAEQSPYGQRKYKEQQLKKKLKELQERR